MEQTAVGEAGLTDRRQQSKLTRPKLTLTISSELPRKANKKTNKREDAEQLSSSPDDLFCIEGSAFWFAMKSLDLLLLSWCLCSLNTLGGKAQVDTICPCNTGWRDYVILYKANSAPTRKYLINNGSQQETSQE